MEQSLIDSEKRLHSVIQGFSIPAFVIGKDHKVLYWNRALARLSKIPASEVIGTNQHWRAFYDKERPCMADLLVDSALAKVPKWYSGKYRKSDLIEESYEATDFFPVLGKKGRWLRFTAAAIRDSHGDLVGAVETLEDITEQKEAEESLKKAARVKK
ncbi:MAG: PAS domain-containing protein [Syntrophaceae bacterium]|nr:PAS domain-containing protein [Syntrophaceae bacterium]